MILSCNCDRYLPHNCDRYLPQNCDRYLSHNCDRYVMGPNSYMLQICDRYFCTYILQIFYRTVTYICHTSVSLVRECILVSSIPHLSFCIDIVSQHIPHKHSKESTIKSEYKIYAALLNGIN
jgi:hypothetical protein